MFNRDDVFIQHSRIEKHAFLYFVEALQAVNDHYLLNNCYSKVVWRLND